MLIAQPGTGFGLAADSVHEAELLRLFARVNTPGAYVGKRRGAQIPPFLDFRHKPA